MTFGIHETARRAGHYRWLELRLFEVLGGWVATVPEPEVRLHLATHSHHHAWHAQLWLERMPRLADAPPEQLTAPPDERLAALVGAIEGAEGTADKLAGAYRVLVPALVAAYTVHLRHTTPVSDAPTVRALELCRRDLLEGWQDSEVLLQGLLETPETAQTVGERCAGWQAELAATGGVAGPGTLSAPARWPAVG